MLLLSSALFVAVVVMLLHQLDWSNRKDRRATKALQTGRVVLSSVQVALRTLLSEGGLVKECTLLAAALTSPLIPG